MGIRSASVNFTKGEISPEVEARFDLDIYKAALRKASNVIVRKTGGVRKRPGSRFCANALLASGSRLFPFQFSDSQAYALELGQGLMSPLAFGGRVLETGLKVTAITNASRAKVTVAYHGYKIGDPVWFDGILGMTEINDIFLTVVSIIDANNFTVNFDSTLAGVFTGDTGGQVNTSAPTPTPPPSPPPTPTPTPTPPPVTVGGTRGGDFGTGGSGPMGGQIP